MLHQVLYLSIIYGSNRRLTLRHRVYSFFSTHSNPPTATEKLHRHHEGGYLTKSAVGCLDQLVTSGFTATLSISNCRSLLAKLTASAQDQCHQRRYGSVANPHQFKFQSKNTHASCVIVSGWLGMLKDPDDHDCRSRNSHYESKNDVQ
jgi:hypothetical protein